LYCICLKTVNGGKFNKDYLVTNFVLFVGWMLRKKQQIIADLLFVGWILRKTQQMIADLLFVGWILRKTQQIKADLQVHATSVIGGTALF